MRKGFLCALLATSGIASAGTMGVTTPLNEWTGFYAGGNVGAARGTFNSELSMTNNPLNPLFYTPVIPGINASGSTSLNTTRFAGGAQIGYNQQRMNNVVLGLELSYDYVNINNTSRNTFFYTNTTSNNQYSLLTSSSIKQMGTLRPRLGYACDQYLPYITGGAALTNITYNQTFTESQYALSHTNVLNKTKLGWTLGGGLEYAPIERFSFKIEYLYTSFGHASANSDFIGAGSLTGLSANMSNSLNTIAVQTLLFGVNVHFA